MQNANDYANIKHSSEAGEMAQALAQAAHPEDLGLIPCTYMVAHNLCDYSLNPSVALFWPPQGIHAVHRHKLGKKHPHV